MPRIFQHIDKSSDTLGKVTRLKYIDDITEEDVFYYFEDGSCCNVEFIAPYDTQDPLRIKKAMIEVPSPNSIWKFKKRVVEFDVEQKSMMGPDGQVYYAPQPENITTDENGIPINTDHAKPGDEVWEVERAPRIPTNYKAEDDDNYLLSLHPELETPTTPSSSTGSFIKKKAKPASVSVPKKSVTKKVEPVQDFNFDAEEGALGTVPTLCQEESLEDINMRQQAIILNYEDEIRRLKNENERLLKAVANQPQDNDIYTIPDEDPFIKSMVTKSKKKTCKITMSIQFDLPPKEVYDTIKTAYEDGMADKFVSSLTARIPRQSLLESLNGGLKRFYEGKPASSASAEKPATAPKK